MTATTPPYYARLRSLFSLPDVNVIVPDRNHTALVDLGREDERLDVGYGVLCHRFDVRGRAASTIQLVWTAFLGSRVVPSASRIALSYYCPLASHDKNERAAIALT